MKTVFTNSEIVHVFNQQQQYKGRTGSMFFYGKELYSYGSHYLLCEFLDNDTVLINDKGYSNTTAKHIALITGATRNRKQFFITKTDTEIVLNNVKNWLNKLTRARKTKEFYLNSINDTFKMYFDFIEYKKLKTAKRKDKNHRQILKLHKAFINDFDNLEAQIKEAQIKQIKKDKELIKQKLKDWKNLKIHWFSNKTNTDFLRLRGENIETSQGVTISVNEGKRLLKLIELNKIRGAKVDDKYIVTNFSNLLKVGCHNIPLSEINYIKNLIKL